MSKQTAEIIIRHLLGVVAALRSEYKIQEHKAVALEEKDIICGAMGYNIENKTPATGESSGE